jgi:hypothetical protein
MTALWQGHCSIESLRSVGGHDIGIAIEPHLRLLRESKGPEGRPNCVWSHVGCVLNPVALANGTLNREARVQTNGNANWVDN